MARYKCSVCAVDVALLCGPVDAPCCVECWHAAGHDDNLVRLAAGQGREALEKMAQVGKPQQGKQERLV